MREAYFAAITLIDTHVGRILDALEETGQMDNTIILFTSDHGEMLGDRAAYQKHFPHEGSAHIPLIACGPGFTPGTESMTPVTTWDVAATIFEAGNAELPATHPLVGRSLRTEADMPADRIAVFHHGRARGRYVAAVGFGHKFVHWYNGGEEELYDLDNDPREQVNLVGQQDSVTQETAEKLRNACIEFEHIHGDPDRVCNGQFQDLEYQTPPKHKCSLYPSWSYRQYPPWTVGYSRDDLDAIAAEMRDCLNSPVAFIHHDQEWRDEAVSVWENMGGNPDVLRAIFRDADAKQE
jgi:arylsulfatase A-like enzyme